MKIQNYPLVKVLFPYVVGILIAYLGDFPDTTCRMLRWVAGATFLSAVAMTFVRAYRWRVVRIVVMETAFVFAGIVLTNSHFHPKVPDEVMEANADWLVRVAAEPTPRERSVKVEAENAGKDDAVSSEGAIVVNEGDVIVISPCMERGSFNLTIVSADDGTVVYDERTDQDTIEAIIIALAAAGLPSGTPGSRTCLMCIWCSGWPLIETTSSS